MLGLIVRFINCSYLEPLRHYNRLSNAALGIIQSRERRLESEIQLKVVLTRRICSDMGSDTL